ncbi:MAG: glutathione S-transferase N-terminal domain-containing protein [Alphaproteobacteria bacterium]|nr:glutathione S-transferase N-terminal domain-containing protein [Alphaproteobacteria bacterium]MCY4607015.1 glutathione S-transferase N-terminal domain-containing protein [bacterium]
MIDLYFDHTPNGQKVHIMLEECELAYNLIIIDIGKGEQFDPDFLKISPNNKVPAIVDHEGPGGDPIALFESGAILLYLAEKTGRFLPTEPQQRWDVMQWLFWQMGGFGPMLGQAHHFLAYAPMNPAGPQVLPYAQNRYRNEASRLYGVLDRQLGENNHVAGDAYSIADMAIFPWCRLHERQEQDLDDFPNVKRWYGVIGERPAVTRDIAASADIVTGFTPESWSVSFGADQYRKRS